jgi:hypothetical protein
MSGKKGMVEDFVTIRAAIDLFMPRLDALSRCGEDLAAIEDSLQFCVGQLAHDLGLRRTLTCRLADLDLPKFSVLPSAHQRASVFKIKTSGDLEVLLNKSSIIERGHRLVSRIPIYVWLFGTVATKFPTLRREWTCYLGDPGFWNTVAFSSTHPEACLVPDPLFFQSGSWADFRAAMTANPIPWQARIPKAFWRGHSTGIKRYWPPRAADDMSWLARGEFCSRARCSSIASHIDVGLVGWVQIPDPEMLQVLQKSGLNADFVPKEKFAQYKYVFDIDGNSNSWPGLFTSLLTAACVIKIESEYGFRQWYYDRLIPWTHYVPVRSDLSDLESKLQWVLGNDERAREIGEAGFALAQSLDYSAELGAAVGRLVTWCCYGNRNPGRAAVNR